MSERDTVMEGCEIARESKLCGGMWPVNGRRPRRDGRELRGNTRSVFWEGGIVKPYRYLIELELLVGPFQMAR